MKQYFVLIVFIMFLILQPLSQTLEKKGMNQIGQITNLHELMQSSTLWRIASNPYIILGIALAVFSLILWLTILSNVNMSYINAMGSLMYIPLTIMALFVLGEHISVTRFIGIGVIMAGCFLVNL